MSKHLYLLFTLGQSSQVAPDTSSLLKEKLMQPHSRIQKQWVQEKGSQWLITQGQKGEEAVTRGNGVHRLAALKKSSRKWRTWNKFHDLIYYAS